MKHTSTGIFKMWRFFECVNWRIESCVSMFVDISIPYLTTYSKRRIFGVIIVESFQDSFSYHTNVWSAMNGPYS